MTATHTHDDSRTLTWGCPACVERVRRDQETARWRDAPVRRCTWSFDAREYGVLSFTTDVRVPNGANAWQIEDWYPGIVGQGIVDALIRVGCPSEDQPDHMYAKVRCTIGPVVEDVAAMPTIDHPSLFEALQ